MPLPAHMAYDLRFRGLDRRKGGEYISPRSEQPERQEQGKRRQSPWESRKADWAHLVVRLGRPTSCAGGEAREAPKPNERVDPETPDPARLLGALEPEGLRVAGGFGFRRARGLSGSFSLLGFALRRSPLHTSAMAGARA